MGADTHLDLPRGVSPASWELTYTMIHKRGGSALGRVARGVRIVPDTSKWCQECTLDVVMGLDSLEGFPSTCSVTRRDGKQTQASMASQGLLQSAFWVSISGTRLKITWAFLEISDRNVEQRRVKKIQTAVEGPSLHACTRPLTVLVLGGRHASVCLA